MIAVATVGAAALALIAARSSHSPALPPVADTDTSLAANEADEVNVPDDARYVAVDLDRDGTPELVALGEGPAGAELVVVEEVHHAVLARIPFAHPGSPCASDFSVDRGELEIDDYAATPFGDNACRLSATRHYTMFEGQLQESMTLIDF